MPPIILSNYAPRRDECGRQDSEPWEARAFEQKPRLQERGQSQGREASTGREADGHPGPVSSAFLSSQGQAWHHGPSSMRISRMYHHTPAPNQETRAVPKPEVTKAGDPSKEAPSRASQAQNRHFTLDPSSFLPAGRTFSLLSQCFCGIFRQQQHLSQWYILTSRNRDI